MNFLDIIILVLLGLSFLGGLKDGFLKKLIMLLSLIVALLFATKFSGFFVKFLMNNFGLSYVISLLIGFVVILSVINILAFYIYKKIVDTSSIISIWDKLGGAVLGLIESGIILSLIFLFLDMLNFPSRSAREGSVLYYTIYNFAPEVYNFVKGIIPGTGDFFNEIKSKF